jgi:hypothetical protein
MSIATTYSDFTGQSISGTFSGSIRGATFNGGAFQPFISRVHLPTESTATS